MPIGLGFVVKLAENLPRPHKTATLLYPTSSPEFDKSPNNMILLVTNMVASTVDKHSTKKQKNTVPHKGDQMLEANHQAQLYTCDL